MIQDEPRAGVIGYPIGHSLSPALYRFWLNQLRTAGSYLPAPCLAENFSPAIEALRRTGFKGVNVTVPHKEAAYALAHTLDKAAQQVGAVNLLLFEGDRIAGWNTDVRGLRESLIEEFGPGRFSGSVALLLGAGGAARAAIQALLEMGFREIRILSRNGARAAALAGEFQPRTETLLKPMDWNDRAHATQGSSLLVNATPAGMRGMPPLEFSLDALPASAAVYDLVYNPLETALVKQARARGHPSANGLGMLIHQAVPAFAALFGSLPGDVAGARRHLEKALAA